MRCNKCKKESHKGCTGLTRDAYQSLLNNHAWTCEKCDFSAPPGYNTIPTDHPTDGAGPKRTGSKRNLRGLQWNADGINTKVAELNRLVVELDIDVALIQDTKLTSRSKTPQNPWFYHSETRQTKCRVSWWWFTDCQTRSSVQENRWCKERKH